MLKKSVKIGENELSIETGRLAKQADGSVVVRYGDTMLLVTAVSAREKKDIDFLPLTVEYQEKLYSAGRIPGSYFKREGRLTEKETLASRVVDRSLRPLFPEGYAYETQVISSVISADPENEGDIHGITGASAALWVSDIPFNGPIAGIRVGRVGGQFVANPTAKQREQSDLDLVMAVSREAIVMVEGGAEEVSEADMVAALEFGRQNAQPALDIQDQLRTELKKQVRSYDKPATIDEGLRNQVRELALEGVKAGYAIKEKGARYEALSKTKKAAVAALKEKLGAEFTPQVEKHAKQVIEDLKYDHMRELTVNGGRIGDRPHNVVRSITNEVGVLPRTHGSAVFTRGETQALVVATLGTSEDEQRLELLSGQAFKRFMLHYNFPPFSVNETKPLRGPGRREVGHGALAERALRNMIPASDSFPYTVRLVSEILESNGSSSMASVCGGTLALMDAGVPIKAPVAGIAMGLVKEGEKIAILSDILGDEDHLGDMDFKVCGTSKGITSIQMDIKITGLTTEIMSRALEQARQGRVHILAEMAKTLDAPRKEISQFAPRITTIQIRPEFIKNVIGPGGKVIKDIIARTGAAINIEDTGRVDIASANGEAVKAAIAMIQALTREAEIGKIYTGTVRKIAEFGAFVELFPGTDGLIHISELSDKRVKSVSDVLTEGDEVLVKVVSIDKTGKIRLSRKEAMAERTAAQGTPPAAAAPAAPTPDAKA
ncbi:polyribonucleotide nucleotidyltransferase [Corallococcus exiguus]|nr:MULTISPECIES: polyribonucleotide nucleotidyltransferase [Corallococcus]NNC21479.1 polyribonucleotide nucleotidyltransferase [Corallococcus exiguus]NPC73588.1 polyribonucleotide nucleotidyltransferase [Corallococcus exiguus]NPD29583.1 polyribonucleotide nucleotidyltransferase [Corallococcus exiguus]NRD50420.1 polyribonucleotide nucleotidyltransferase [Corallococcus exiguus]NRD56498.1 polyribonucleotide nucleotidyltransferase [Corallococcus exiguus]